MVTGILWKRERERVRKRKKRTWLQEERILEPTCQPDTNTTRVSGWVKLKRVQVLNGLTYQTRWVGLRLRVLNPYNPFDWFTKWAVSTIYNMTYLWPVYTLNTYMLLLYCSFSRNILIRVSGLEMGYSAELTRFMVLNPFNRLTCLMNVLNVSYRLTYLINRSCSCWDFLLVY